MIKNQDAVSFECEYNFGNDFATIIHTRESLMNKIPKEANRRTLGVLLEERVDSLSHEAIEAEGVRSEKEGVLDLIEASNDEKADVETLKQARKAIESVPLAKDPEAQRIQIETVAPLLKKIIDRIRQMEAPKKMEVSLKDLGDIQRMIKQALDTKNYRALNTLNQKVLASANEVKRGLDELRRHEPDRLYGMVRELFCLNPEVARLYKTILVHYVGTHNTFEFSLEILEELRNKSSDAKRGRFAEALHSAYVNRPKHDRVVDFYQKTTRIPENRIMEVLKKVA